MEPVIAIAIGAVMFLLLMIFLPKIISADASRRTRNIIEKIASGASDPVATATGEPPPPEDEHQILKSFKLEAAGLVKIFLALPKTESLFVLMIKAGYLPRAQSVLTGMIGLAVALAVLLASMFGAIGAIIAPLAAFFITKKYLQHALEKRNRLFLDMFPEALDMIVRSVKSGHPLNTALRMIADNMEEPVGPEFRQLVNEITYGRPLVEALQRLAKRIDESDIHFFVVVLSVQQETGGNLAEIMGNLSNVIRGRKRLNLKIRAMTSEGRATGWVLGSLPILQMGALKVSSPEYLDPLFDTVTGNMLFALAMSLIVAALWIVSKMIKIDI